MRPIIGLALLFASVTAAAQQQGPEGVWICGLQIIGNLSPSGSAKWSGGWVYDPDHGQTYGAELTLESRDALRMRGYIAIPLFGGSQLWRRAPADLPRCPTAG